MPEVVEWGLEEDHPTWAEVLKEVGHKPLAVAGGTELGRELDC